MHANTTWSLVDNYMTERLIPRDDVLEQVMAANQREELPPIDVSASQGKLLQLLARMTNAKRILEIGTLGGYSTIWMGKALPADGKLVTLELDPKHAQVAQANIALAGLSRLVEIRVGVALEQLAKLEEEGTEPFDLIFIDADKPSNPAYLQWALRFSHPGTVIVGDNVVRDGEIINRHSTDPRVQGIRTFYDMLAAEPRISATAIQTVGSKGYDGFMIGIVNG
ncbi:O-methyltransferase [Paenibacillus rhizovicinus]|uniref:O-methyltransferase n=1 Tax=Paenibacillus rhizovicinus TaxID=2704463 RepID=A0A6C0P8S9_9BACL|nr:O-methyltransferase [Paenibacillus rhizovicinus]QHW34033.1 O-methyltransferase [Paenibacillus rhizovicinus]